MARPRKYSSDAEKQQAYRERNRNVTIATKIDHPALRWLGGKWRLGSWIIDHFPPHITYVEPFAGGASVLLRKAPSEIEVINDLNSDVVNFFDVLRGAPGKLIRAIELTPFSREIHQRAFQPCDDPIEKALRFYVRCWQSFQPGSDGTSSGWRFQKTNNRGKPVTSDWSTVEHLYAIAKRIKSVQIEHDDALSVINRFDGPEVLFYLDPPYVIDTRSHNNTVLYKHEMDDSDHHKLAMALNSIQGMAIVSGYPHSTYDNLFKGWQTVTKSSTTNRGGESTECLWISPKVTEAIKRANQVDRLPLFAV